MKSDLAEQIFGTIPKVTAKTHSKSIKFAANN
jgi:hypothetical protein